MRGNRRARETLGTLSASYPPAPLPLTHLPCRRPVDAAKCREVSVIVLDSHQMQRILTIETDLQILPVREPDSANVSGLQGWQDGAVWAPKISLPLSHPVSLRSP